MAATAKAVTCPACGARMAARRSSRGPFFGCSTYPRCKAIVQADEHGRPVLPEDEKPDPSFKPSAYQAAILDWIENGKGHGVVRATAGSGKTTTLVHAARKAKGSLLFLAFNVHIVKTLKSRLLGREVSTVSAAGRRVVFDALPKRPLVDEDGSKIAAVLNELFPTSGMDKNFDIQQGLRKVVPLAKSTLVDADDPEAVMEMIYRFGIDCQGADTEVAAGLREALRLCRERLSVIDFNDMIWLPHALGLQPSQRYDWVFIDEAQDLSRAQQELVLKLVKPRGGRVLAVGDAWQAIYGWAGADTESMDRLTARLDATTLPLSISYRCPRKVVELAQAINPEIEPAESAPDGEVAYLVAEKAIEALAPGDMGLCRVNAPLAPIAMRLIRQGKKVIIRGRDIGKGLVSLINRLRPKNDINLLAQKLAAYREREGAKLFNNPKAEAKLQTLYDTCDTIEALMEGAEDVTEVVGRIETIFSDQNAGIVLSSIHRAKGLEADNITVISPEIMPMRASSAWRKQEEKNLQFVCFTRAKKRLVFAEGPTPGAKAAPAPAAPPPALPAPPPAEAP